jgi:hypothetical protein
MARRGASGLRSQRLPLPRRRTPRLAARARRTGARGGVPPERRLRLGRPVCGNRRDPAGARGGTRDPRDLAGGEGGRRGGRGAHHPLQPLWPRALRHAYDSYFAGKLEDVALDEEEMQRALRAIEGLPTRAQRRRRRPPTYGHRRGNRGLGKNVPSGFRIRSRSRLIAVTSGVSRKLRRTRANHLVAGMYSSRRIAAGPCISRTPLGSISCHDSLTSCSGIRVA